MSLSFPKLLLSDIYHSGRKKISFSSQKRGSISSESPPLYVTHPQEENEEERSKGEKRSLVSLKESLVMKKERVSQQVMITK